MQTCGDYCAVGHARKHVSCAHAVDITRQNQLHTSVACCSIACRPGAAALPAAGPSACCLPAALPAIEPAHLRHPHSREHAEPPSHLQRSPHTLLPPAHRPLLQFAVTQILCRLRMLSSFCSAAALLPVLRLLRPHSLLLPPLRQWLPPWPHGLRLRVPHDRPLQRPRCRL